MSHLPSAVTQEPRALGVSLSSSYLALDLAELQKVDVKSTTPKHILFTSQTINWKKWAKRRFWSGKDCIRPINIFFTDQGTASYGVDIDAVAGWLGSYGGEDSTSDISRGQ